VSLHSPSLIISALFLSLSSKFTWGKSEKTVRGERGGEGDGDRGQGKKRGRRRGEGHGEGDEGRREEVKGGKVTP
jgi:hypothetical protein